MSYVRFGKDSDVYVYDHVRGYICCCACRFHEKTSTDGYAFEKGKVVKSNQKFSYYEDQKLKSVASAIIHLARHRAAGHKVPLYVSQLLKEDLVRGQKAKRKFRRRVDLLARIQQHRFPEEYRSL